MRFRWAALFLAVAPALLAHTGEPLERHDLWAAWTFDAGVVVPLAVAALLYARGARRQRGVAAWQMWCFWSGWTVLALSLVSPLHRLGEVLFSAHMVQHESLMLIAAPLLVLSRPLVSFVWGLPFEWRRVAGRWCKARAVQLTWRGMTGAFTAWLIHAFVLWVWHAPVMFQATLISETAHAAQHVSFLGSALLFWWALFHASGRMGHGAAVLYVFTTSVHTSILGALLSFSPALWYPAYEASAPNWGLTPLQDQQIGGLIMWVPAGVVYLAAGLALFAAWLRESDAVLRRRRYAE